MTQKRDYIIRKNLFDGVLDAPLKVHRLRVVEDRVGLKKTTIYTRIAEGKFPKQILLSKRSVGWLEADITNWLQQRIEESKKEGY